MSKIIKSHHTEAATTFYSKVTVTSGESVLGIFQQYKCGSSTTASRRTGTTQQRRLADTARQLLGYWGPNQDTIS